MVNEIFETMPVRKAYMKVALPVVMSMVVSLIYNMVDTYFISQTGDVNLIAGVSLAAPFFTLMIALGDILGLGGSSLISRLFGEQKVEEGRKISSFCFYGALLEGVIVTVVMLIFHQPILDLLGTDEQTWHHTFSYFRIIALGAPFIILSFTPSNQLRSEGLATESMIGTVLGAIVNMILDPIFILMLNWGAAGAAFATVIGYVCSDLYFVWVLLKKSKKLSIQPQKCRVTKKEFASILAIGIPASITNLMQSLGIMLTNRFLLPYGNDKIATMGIVMKVNMIAILILVGFAFGGQALVGYNFGAKNKKRFEEIVAFAYRFETGLAIVISVLLILLATPIVTLFLKDADMVAVGVPMLRLQLVSMICVASVLVSTCICQAIGQAFGAFLLSISRQGILFALVIVLAANFFGYYGVLASQAISDALTFVIAMVLYRKVICHVLDE